MQYLNCALSLQPESLSISDNNRLVSNDITRHILLNIPFNLNYTHRWGFTRLCHLHLLVWLPTLPNTGKSIVQRSLFFLRLQCLFMSVSTHIISCSINKYINKIPNFIIFSCDSYILSTVHNYWTSHVVKTKCYLRKFCYPWLLEPTSAKFFSPVGSTSTGITATLPNMPPNDQTCTNIPLHPYTCTGQYR